MCWSFSSSQKQIVKPYMQVASTAKAIMRLSMNQDLFFQNQDLSVRWPSLAVPNLIHYCQPFPKNIINPIVCFLQKKLHFLRYRELSLLKSSSPAWHVPPRGVPSTYKTPLLRRSSIPSIPPSSSSLFKMYWEHLYGVRLLFLLQNCQKSWKDQNMLEPEHHSRPVHVCRSQTPMI